MDIHAFCDKVDKICEEQYDLEDGGDLCFNLVEMGEINMADGEDNAARITAQHLLQA
jgi:hypothetical protein